MMGVFKLHLFAASLLVGFLGGLLGAMSGARFWLMHAALIGAGAVLLAVLRAVFRRVLAPGQSRLEKSGRDVMRPMETGPVND